MEHKIIPGAFARRESVHPTGTSPHAKEDLHHPEARSGAPHRQFSDISHSTPLLAQCTCSPGGGKKRKGFSHLKKKRQTRTSIPVFSFSIDVQCWQPFMKRRVWKRTDIIMRNFLIINFSIYITVFYKGKLKVKIGLMASWRLISSHNCPSHSRKFKGRIQSEHIQTSVFKQREDAGCSKMPSRDWFWLIISSFHRSI